MFPKKEYYTCYVGQDLHDLTIRYEENKPQALAKYTAIN